MPVQTPRMISPKWIAICSAALVASALVAFVGLWATAPEATIDSPVETSICGLNNLTDVVQDESFTLAFRANVARQLAGEIANLEGQELSETQTQQVAAVNLAIRDLNDQLGGNDEIQLPRTPKIPPVTVTVVTVTPSPTPIDDLAQPPAGPTSTPDPRPPCLVPQG